MHRVIKWTWRRSAWVSSGQGIRSPEVIQIHSLSPMSPALSLLFLVCFSFLAPATEGNKYMILNLSRSSVPLPEYMLFSHNSLLSIILLNSQCLACLHLAGTPHQQPLVISNYLEVSFSELYQNIFWLCILGKTMYIYI